MRRAVLKVSATDGNESNMDVLQDKSLCSHAAKAIHSVPSVRHVAHFLHGRLRLAHKPRVDESGEFLHVDSENSFPVHLKQ